MHTTHNLLLKFYDSFSKANAQSMAECYHPEATFKDPAFGTLNQQEVTAMWQMLVERSKGNLTIEFSNVSCTDYSGSVDWVATYDFSQTNRKVINFIQAKFEFKDGLIIKHTDTFNLWKWSGMALGWKGYLLGWTPFMQNKIRSQAKTSLKNYMKRADLS